MIWSIFNKAKEPHILLNELNSEDQEVHKNAYKELLNHPSQEAESLMMISLTGRETPRQTVLAIIDILGHRGCEDAVPTFVEMMSINDTELKLTLLEAFYEISNPECIDQLVSKLTDPNDVIKSKSIELLQKLPENDILGALLRAVPSNHDSELYFGIVSLMEEMDLFKVIKENFSQPDLMVKEFYFDSLSKFNRPEFIPLFLEYYPQAQVKNKDVIVKLLREYDVKESLPFFKEYISQKGSEGICNLIDSTLIYRYSEAPLDLLQFVISIPDSRYKIKTLPNLLKKADIYSYDSVFKLLNESTAELKEMACSTLISLIKKTWKRLNDSKEPNRLILQEMYNKWQTAVTSYMRNRDELSEDFYKCIRKLFFEFCQNDHELLTPFIGDLVNKNFFETYYLLRDWSFDEKFNLYSWLIKNEPSFGMILLSSLGARADETLWRLTIKLSNSFEDEEDANVFRKNLTTRYRDISFERFLKDDDPGVRSAAIEICSNLKLAGFLEFLKSAVKDAYPEVRKSAIKCMMDNYFSKDFMLECLNDPDEDNVLYILTRLKNKIGIQALSPYLVRFVNSGNDGLREFAKSEIAAITIERYKSNYNNMAPATRKLAAQAIQKLDSNFTNGILSDLSSFDPQTRLRAALLLENIQLDTKGKDALISAMKDPSKKVRAALVKTLGVVGDKEIVKQLIEFFNDPDPRVRANTVEAVASLGDNQVVQILLPFLDDNNNRIRANAVVGIRKFGKFNVAPVLQSMLAHEDDNMKASALWAIGEIGDTLYLPLTYPFMTNKNELIRYNSIKAISRINPQLLSPYMAMYKKDSSSKIKQLIKELSFKVL